MCFFEDVLGSRLLIVCLGILELLDERCDFFSVFQFLFGAEFLKDCDLVVGVVFFCFLGLGDDGIEIVVAEEKDAEEIVGGLVGGL